jgi:hypothetical protein
MIETYGFLNRLSREFHRLIRTASNPEHPGQGNARTIAIVEAEMQRIDLGRKWQLRQGGFQIAESGAAISFQMVGNSKRHLNLREQNRIAYRGRNTFATLGSCERFPEIPNSYMEEVKSFKQTNLAMQIA